MQRLASMPAAIHLSPEAADGGPLARPRDGDMVRLDAATGTLTTDADLDGREAATSGPTESEFGMGRELLTTFRGMAGSAETGVAVVL